MAFMKLTAVTAKESVSVNREYRSDEHKRSVKNYDCRKNEITKHRLTPREIKETIHSWRKKKFLHAS